MKRRAFLISASTVAIGLPLAYYFKRHYWKVNNSIVMPGLLGSFCDENTLRNIGLEYRKQVPAENDKQKLLTLIFTDSNNKKVNTSDKLVIDEFISKKNSEDFLKHQTTIIRGWIISITEARQCALFSLT